MNEGYLHAYMLFLNINRIHGVLNKNRIAQNYTFHSTALSKVHDETIYICVQHSKCEA